MLEYAPMVHVSCYARNYICWHNLARPSAIIKKSCGDYVPHVFSSLNLPMMQTFSYLQESLRCTHTDIQTWPHTTHLQLHWVLQIRLAHKTNWQGGIKGSQFLSGLVSRPATLLEAAPPPFLPRSWSSHGYTQQHILVAVLVSAGNLYQRKFEGSKLRIMDYANNQVTWSMTRHYE